MRRFGSRDIRGLLKDAVQGQLAKTGHVLVKNNRLPEDLDPDFWPLYQQCREYTMTSVERMYGLHKATRYIVDRGVPGAIVECGVWRGGSAMLAALNLRPYHVHDRHVYLYDTFAGMPAPGAKDVASDIPDPAQKWADDERAGYNEWNYSPLEEVRENFRSTGFPEDRAHFVQGRVEETLPQHAPEQVALLRLDTDFYASTRHEMEHLYPRLVPGGVLIVDDYGLWAGSREAVDEFFAGHGQTPLLNRLDFTGRIAVKG